MVRSHGQKHEQGVSFAIRNIIIPFCETPVGITTRLKSLRVHTSKGVLMIFSVYATTPRQTIGLRMIFINYLSKRQKRSHELK